MNRGVTKRNTVLFIGFFLLAGIANLLSRTRIPMLDALMSCISDIIYISLLLFWIQSVRIRLLPAPARSCMLASAFLMLFYLSLRIFKYRFATDVSVTRYAVYLYYIPMALIPSLFLMTCLCILKGVETGGRRILLPLIPGGVLALTALTNDLHQQFYRIQTDPALFVVETGTYTPGLCFYLMYEWIVLAILAGLVLLFRTAGKRSSKSILFLAVCTFIWIGMVLLIILVLDRYQMIRMYNVPEIHIFGMLSVFEFCVRNRLIPYNENYAECFRKLQMPAVITDTRFRPVYRTETVPAADGALLRSALENPVYPEPDQHLSGRRIRAGYAFWQEDESAVRRAQERLMEANEMIEDENALLRAETEQKEKDAYLQSRHRIDHEIASEMYPCQQKIAEILESAVPGTDSFRERIAEVSVLNAFVKRKTNLLLLASEHETLTFSELYLALQESASYLTLAGLRATVQKAPDAAEKAASSGTVIALYDAFENLAEQLMGNTSSMMVLLNKNGIRIAADTGFSPATDGLPLPAEVRREEGVLYLELLIRKDGENP